MSHRDPSGQHPGDMPWNDVAADDDVVPGTEEPEPAEVVGSDDDDAERDQAAHPAPDPVDKYRRDSLSQRLAEEQPDRPERRSPPGVEVFAAADGADAGEAEADDQDQGPDDQSAEEAAIHLTDEP